MVNDGLYGALNNILYDKFRHGSIHSVTFRAACITVNGHEKLPFTIQTNLRWLGHADTGSIPFIDMRKVGGFMCQTLSLSIRAEFNMPIADVFEQQPFFFFAIIHNYTHGGHTVPTL